MDFKTLVKIALEVQEKKPFFLRPISSTIGRLNDYMAREILGTSIWERTASGMKDPELREVIEELKDKPELADVLVSFGGPRFFPFLKRIWKNKNLDFVTKLDAILGLPGLFLSSALGRSDFFDPYANAVVIYHKDPAVLRHELAHAEDFARSKYPNLYTLARTFNPDVMQYQEVKASVLALKNVLDRIHKNKKVTEKDINDILHIERVLSAAYDTYSPGFFGAMMALRGFELPEISMKSPLFIGNIFHDFLDAVANYMPAKQYDKVRNMIDKYLESAEKEKEKKKKKE